MWSTTISALFAIFLFFFSSSVTVHGLEICFFILFVSFAFFFLSLYLQSTAWLPLQHAEKNSSPRVLELFRKNPQIRLACMGLEITSLVSVLLAITLYLFGNFNQVIGIAVWIFLIGLSFDLARYFTKHLSHFIDPYQVVILLRQAALQSIKKQREAELCDWIEAMAELGIRALQRSNISLGNEVLDGLQKISGDFLERSKNSPVLTKDKVHYTLFYLLERMELVHEKALEKMLEPTCASAISSLGKVILNAAKIDLNLTGYPIYYLGKCATRAQQKGLHEVGVKASLTLFEIANILIDNVNRSTQPIKDTYTSLIVQMHEIAKETFKQDKDTRIDLLTDPFRQLKELFQSSKMAQHPDTAEIIFKIDSVLAEFSALELVLKTIPQIPKVTEENLSTSP